MLANFGLCVEQVGEQVGDYSVLLRMHHHLGPISLAHPAMEPNL
jgi:hypothetical protein